MCDSGNDRIQEFTIEGKYLSKLGSEGRRRGQLTYPLAIEIDTAARLIYVSEGPPNYRLQVFCRKTRTPLIILESGLSSPMGIALDCLRLQFFLVDQGHHAIVKWRLREHNTPVVTSDDDSEPTIHIPKLASKIKSYLGFLYADTFQSSPL